MSSTKSGRPPFILAALFLGTFVLGTAELLVPGVLNLIADDLHVSVPAVGALVTANALGIAIGGPILTALTVRSDKRTVLIAALVLFIVANLALVLTGSYSLIVAARVLAGATQGLFIGAGFAAGTSVVPPERTGRAMSVVISGVTVSAALGVPLGTLAGQALGWRGTFVAVVVLAALALVAVLALVPSVPASGGGIGDQAKHALAPRVLAVLALGMLVFASLQAVITYIAPFLQSITGVSGSLISVFLLAYGAATAIGSFGGGRFADTNAARTLVVAAGGVAVSLLALYFVGSVAWLVVLVLIALGVFGMGAAPVLQYRVVNLAGPGGQLAQSLPASAVNLGIAFGSTVGGMAIGGLSAAATVLTGVAIAAAAVVVAWATSTLKPPASKQAVNAAPTPQPATGRAA